MGMWREIKLQYFRRAFLQFHIFVLLPMKFSQTIIALLFSWRWSEGVVDGPCLLRSYSQREKRWLRLIINWMGHQDIAKKFGCGRIPISPDVKARRHIAYSRIEYRPLGPGCLESICLRYVHLHRIHPPTCPLVYWFSQEKYFKGPNSLIEIQLLKYCAWLYVDGLPWSRP